MFLGSNYQLLSKIMTSFYFPLALVRSNNSHCQLINLFKSKESFKEKVDSDNNKKTEWF